MREIGRLENETRAAQFGDCLYVRGIENQVDPEDDGMWSVWVHDDEQIPEATALLEQFRANPSAGQFNSASELALKKRGQEEKKSRKGRSSVLSEERVNYERRYFTFAYLPTALAAISILVAVLSQVGADTRSVQYLFISNHGLLPYDDAFLPEVRDGQLWRLITPIFLHFGYMHIVFNMMWLTDLGGMIERRLGFWHLLTLVIVVAVISNVSQYLWDGPAFGGMSGVNYGLFGFAWMKGKFDPASNLELHKTTVQTMLGWLVLCMTGLMGPVANMVHATGLVTGMICGLISARHFPRLREFWK